MGVLEEYIVSEQRLARIDSKVDAKLAAYLLMASSFFALLTRRSSESQCNLHGGYFWNNWLRRLSLRRGMKGIKQNPISGVPESDTRESCTTTRADSRVADLPGVVKKWAKTARMFIDFRWGLCRRTRN